MSLDVFDTMWEQVEEQLDEVFAATVTYTRGASTASVVASRISHSFEVAEDGSGIPTHIDGGEWLLVAQDIDFGAGAVAPQRGDRIVANGQTFELLPVGGKPVADHLKERGRYLVRTKKVA